MFEEYLGHSLLTVESALQERGYRPNIIKYVSKRGVEGADDWRVLRCTLGKENTVDVVVSAFLTDIRETMV